MVVKGMTTHTAVLSGTRSTSRQFIWPGVAALFIFGSAFGQAQQKQLMTAPLNPQFGRGLASASGIQSTAAVSSHATGHRTSPLGPVMRPMQTAGTQAQTRAASSLPATYDLRLSGRLTPVKNQGACGACWAFATTGSLESGLMPAESWSFSENNIKNTHGFDISPCNGGNVEMATAYLARWPGPINEADDPYQPTDFNSSPSGLSPRKHLQDIIYIAPRTGALDNTALKQAIMSYGAVDISLAWDDTWYNAGSYSYNDPNVTGSNHEVAIVGWDDNFDRTRFNSQPAGNGAFIARNSWGSGWGQGGYFYISYYDANAGVSDNSAAFSGAESTSNWTRAYQYDPLGWTGSYGFPNSDIAWFANVFTAQGDESIGAVSFYSNSPNAPYLIRIYTGVSGGPTSGTLAGTTTGTVATAGYHTIRLSSPVTVGSGSKFAVVVELQTPGYNYPIPAEIPYTGYSSAATAAVGQSFASSDGTNWIDLNVPFLSNVNVCLKAFTNPTTSAPPPPPASPGVPYTPSVPSQAKGDFDGNGVPDIVWQNEATRQVVVWYMGGSDGSTELGYNALYINTDAVGWHVAAIADFDGNGVPDIVWQNDGTRQVTVHYYAGTGGTTDIGWNWLYPGTGAAGWHVVAAADFNGDGKPDLVWQNDSTRQVTVHYYGGSGGAVDMGWNWLYPGTGAAGWHIAAVADFNRDGVPDLVWQNDTTRQVTVHYYNGPGGATDVGWNWLWAGPAYGWHVAAASDFNNDGYPDVVWQNDTTGQVTVHYYAGPYGASDMGWMWMTSATVTPWSVVH